MSCFKVNFKLHHWIYECIDGDILQQTINPSNYVNCSISLYRMNIHVDIVVDN